jgi:hypothetical protein
MNIKKLIIECVEEQIKRSNSLVYDLEITYNHKKDLNNKILNKLTKEKKDNVKCKKIYRDNLSFEIVFHRELDKYIDKSIDSFYKTVVVIDKAKKETITNVILDNFQKNKAYFKLDKKAYFNEDKIIVTKENILSMEVETIVRALLSGFKLIKILETDSVYQSLQKSKESISETLRKKSESIKKILELNLIDDELCIETLTKEYNKIKEYKHITLDDIYKGVFLNITVSLKMIIIDGIKDYKIKNEIAEKIAIDIIKNVYCVKRFKVKITDKRKRIKFNRSSFDIYI